MGQGQAPQHEGPGPSPEVMLPTCSLSGFPPHSLFCCWRVAVIFLRP